MITCFSGHEELRQRLLKDEDLPKCLNSLSFQIERCPTTSRLHLQAFVELSESRTLNQMRYYFGKNIHYIPVTHDHERVRDYCKKTYTRFEGPWTINKSLSL